MKLNRYRDELPLGDDALREIRGNVMKQILDERPARRWLGVFVPATLAATVLVLLVLRPAHPTPVPVPETTRPVQTRPVALTPKPLIEVAEPSVLPTHRPRRTSRRPQRIERTAPAPASAASEPAPMRIELHTSNPDIRILWITHPSGETR